MLPYLLLSVLLVLATGALADTVVIDLPDLTGDYQTGWYPPTTSPVTRSTSFVFPPDIQSLQDLRVVMSGTWVQGLVSCSNPYGGPPDTTSYSPGLAVHLRAPAAFDKFFHATVGPPDGPFDQLTAVFDYIYPPNGADPNEMLGEIVSVELECQSMFILPCNPLNDSYGVLTEVRIEALGAVPTTKSSFGNVKALFR